MEYEAKVYRPCCLCEGKNNNKIFLTDQTIDMEINKLPDNLRAWAREAFEIQKVEFVTVKLNSEANTQVFYKAWILCPLCDGTGLEKFKTMKAR